MKRAIISKGFLAGFVLELVILWKVGGDSELFRVTVPVISTFPYATAWLADYQSGYIKAYLPRCGRTSYICGKFLACGIAGGLVEMLPCLLYLRFAKNAAALNPLLISSRRWYGRCFRRHLRLSRTAGISRMAEASSSITYW